ncbi:acyltransferase [Actinacidiphila sp. bgisy144]|uniref:acyltransferase n=1 Tax=Actinacidiphila sp. bgisy144 TaxID=3413791 RepID=UPI003EB83663
MDKSDYFDVNTTVERVAPRELSGRLAADMPAVPYPIVRYAQVLKELRKRSSAVGDEQQQMEFGRLVAASFADLAAELGLPEGHFAVDTGGDPLLVKEGTGQHWILPTHFEGGAYFSAPHADHQYGLAAHLIPRLRIGRYVRFGKGSGINAGGDITIGDGAWLSPGSLLLRQDHGAYGRPSVGARTVSMTTQPAITLRDYAWVGRDAMVGWNSDYLGLGSIVGTRSFINNWVGDYSIVGDHDRILQYQPFKAFLLGRYHLTVEETLRISDWAAVDRDWRTVYAEHAGALLGSGDLTPFAESVQDAGAAPRALLVRPGSLRLVPALARGRLDVVTGAQELTPYLLQWASYAKAKRIRVRSDLTGTTLPLETAGTYHYDKRVGYEVVVAEHDPAAPSVPLSELQRVLLPGGVLIAETRCLADGPQTADRLVEVRDIAVDGRSFKVFAKK